MNILIIRLNIRTLIFIGILPLFANSLCSATKGIYEDAFTREIYDISPRAREKYDKAILYKPLKKEDKNYNKEASDYNFLAIKVQQKINQNNSPDEKKAIETLYYQKIVCVHQKATIFLKDTKSLLEEYELKLDQIINGKVGANFTSNLFGSIAEWAKLSITNPLGAIATAGSSLLGKFIGETGNDSVANTQRKDDLNKAIKELNNEINRIEEGVFSESIKDLEEKYIRRKSKNEIKEDLSYSIETLLINSRNSNYPFPYVKQSLEYALQLPSPSSVKEIDKTTVLDSFRKSPFFKNYPSETGKSLENVIVSIAASSKASNDSHVPLRGTYYFYGEAGIGKSCAAEEIGKILGLPTIKVKIKSISELSADNLEGADPINRKINHGWVVKPLLAQEPKTGKTFKNSILILDDFDRVLLDNRSGVTGLAFFLDYLDPLKRSFYSPYFGAEIDISRINIIVTGNTPIPDTKEYEALKERFMDIITFKPMEKSVLQGILRAYISHLEERYSLVFSDSLIGHAIQCAEHPESIRSLKQTLHNLVIDYVAGKWGRVNLRVNMKRKPQLQLNADNNNINSQSRSVFDQIKIFEQTLSQNCGRLSVSLITLYCTWYYLLPIFLSML